MYVSGQTVEVRKKLAVLSSHSTRWVQEMELKVVRFGRKSLYTPSYLINPS